jgi:hypothetical protein
MEDLQRRWATTLDATLLTQATTGLSVVAQAVTYDDTSPTAAEQWPKVQNASSDVETVLMNQAVVDTVVVHGRRWRWILDSGEAVLVDNNVPTNLGAGTNQDEIYVVASAECHLWADPDAPQFIRSEQVTAATLQVLIVVYSYFAYSFRRYTNGMGRSPVRGWSPRPGPAPRP